MILGGCTKSTADSAHYAPKYTRHDSNWYVETVNESVDLDTFWLENH